MSIYNDILSFFTLRQNKFFYLTMAIISVTSLAYAFFVEYILGFEPCVLCLYQRIPYFFLIILSISGVAYPRNNNILLLLAVVLFSSICLASYHTGVERGIFNPSTTCNMGVKIPDNASLEEVRELLYDAPIATCTVAAYRIFKVSMTEWNLILNILLIGFTFLVIRKNRN